MDTSLFNHLENESDVEQKFVMPFLKDVLGFNAEEIKTKEYLSPTNIDKGAGKKMGYYPDYLIYLSGIPVLVLEAKDPSVDVESGYREARLYAAEINKRYPKDVNPVRYVVATNGISIYFSPWDSESDLMRDELRNILEGSATLDKIRGAISRSQLLSHSNQIRNRLLPTHRFKPLTLIGGPARQHAKLAPNTFAPELVPLLRKYFDPDETKSSLEIIERGYCSSDEITQYNSTLEALLKERVLTKKGIPSLETGKKCAPLMDKTLFDAVSLAKDIPDPFILIIGSVGSGKTMFVERYYRFLMPQEIKDNTCWSVIDFNEAPVNLNGLEKWMCKSFAEDFQRRNGDEDFLSFDNLKRYFAPDIEKRNKGPYKELMDTDPEEYTRRMTDDLTSWFDDPEKLTFAIIRYYSKDRDIPVVVVFDNVDKRERDQQLRVFQAVQWFRANSKCFVILSLRDETYDAYKDQPPLDTYLKTFSFRIIAPRFVNVVRKRLELAIEYLVNQSEKNLNYNLPNGMQITYPATKLGNYLISIYGSVFAPTKQTRILLEALAGRNIRIALEMFVDILTSHYLSENFILSITEGKNFDIPEWLVIRILMRTNYEFFSDKHGYIQNIFALPEESRTANNFLVLELLEFLSSRRKSKTSFNIEGYHFAPEIISHMTKFGLLKEDIMWALEMLLNRGLIMADHQRSKGISEDDYIKITASGFYHVRFLSSRSEYLANVPMDTWFNDEKIAKRIVDIHTDSKSHNTERLKLFSDYLTYEALKLSEVIPEFSAAETAINDQISKINRAATFNENYKLKDSPRLF